MTPQATVNPGVARRARELRDEALQRLWIRTDRLFAGLLTLQWFAAVAVALWWTPHSWIGSERIMHMHVPLAVGMGAALTLPALALVAMHPARALTRHVISISQVMYSALFIHLCGGRIETHFHVFGSLAFIAFYRDWLTLVPATLVVAADHMLRGLFWPESVFGSTLASLWRPLEHTAWVLFEDAFLIYSCIVGVSDIEHVAQGRAELESEKLRVEETVAARTAALREQTAAQHASAAILRRTGAMARVGGWDLDVATGTANWTEEVYRIHEVEPGTPIQLEDGIRFYAPEARGRIARAVQNAIDTRESWDMVLPFITAKGRRLWVRAQGEAVVEDGRVVRLCGAFQDVTESETAAQEVARRADEMARLRDAAEAATQAKSEFLANMSHEIRTPLTAILGYADILRESTDVCEHAKETVDTIRSAGQHLLTVINDILDLSKIEAGKMTVESIATQLPLVLHEVASLIRPRAAAKGVHLATRLETPIPDRIMSDPTRLRQILMNVAGNAAKFTDAGSVAIVVRAQAAGGAEFLEFDIEDTGPGLTPAEAAQLFTAFSQGDATVTRRHGGTGLGLIICRRLATLMGGSIALLRTEPGKGSCFRIRLPLIAAPGSVLISSIDVVLDVHGTPAMTSTRLAGRILLAEDGLDNQRLIAFHLRKAGAELAIADNGRIALEMINQAQHAGTPYDLLLSDMQMPEMDGYTLARVLREQGSTLAIIAITAHAMDSDRQKCEDAGCDDYATKPIDKTRLLQTCAKWLGRPSARITAAANG